jgi:hypothetical protein
MEESILQDAKAQVSSETQQNTKPVFDEPLMKGSTLHSKVEIFGRNVKEDSAPTIKLSSFKYTEAMKPIPSKDSIKN